LARYLKEQKEEKEEGGTTGEEAREALLKSATFAVKKTSSLYSSAFYRRRDILGGASRTFEFSGRIIIGLGASNVLEAGLTLNNVYGTPIIPGCALKGLAAHYCSSVWGGSDQEFKAPTGKYYEFIFGSTEDAGFLTFHDAWITPESISDCIVRDVMTPHHGKYYMGVSESGERSAPTDFDDPVPVTFLSVRGKFEVHVSCDGDGEQWEKITMSLLEEALSKKGIGGKTSSGYGFASLCNTRAESPRV
jgi:CRISPR-associated protein Cmr6